MVLELNIPDYTYRIKEVVRVIDGDTVDVMIDLGFYPSQETCNPEVSPWDPAHRRSSDRILFRW